MTVLARGCLAGAVRTPSLVVDEGGRIDGEVSMNAALPAADAPAALVAGSDDVCV